MKTILLSLFVLSSCTSLPKGEPQLRKMMLDDRPRNVPERVSYVHSGRPLYIESTSYPFVMADGHISMNGKLLVYVGREELSLNELLPVKEELSDGAKEKKEEEKVEEKQIPEPPFREIAGGGRMASTQCAKPRIIRHGNCNNLKVEFDLSDCTGLPIVKGGYKVRCHGNEALFGVRHDNIRYRIRTHKLPLPLNEHWNLGPHVQVTYYKP